MPADCPVEEEFMRRSTAGKYPVILDNGRTIIFISDKSRESEVREKYEKQIMQKRNPLTDI